MSATQPIRVAIIGIGNCAKSLIQGIEYYRTNRDTQVGLMYPDIGGYTVDDIQFCLGFDIDKRKVGEHLERAIYAKPNCAMDHISVWSYLACIEEDAYVFGGPILDGVADYMVNYPEDISFRPYDETGNFACTESDKVVNLLKDKKIDVVVNYLPVGSDLATKFYIDAAIEAGCHFINCIPTIISTQDAMETEQRFIDAGLTFIGSDMRSAYGASRLSEVIQGSMLDSGLLVTQHIQMNMAAGSTQGQEHIQCGRSANTDFLNMSEKARLKNKHISKENVLKGQNTIRNESIDGMTMYAGPSLTVLQKPGGQYVGSDNKICNLDIVAYGFGGARYELTARLSVQDSPNSGGVVVSAIRFCKVASELGIVGMLRGPSAWTQKTAPLQLTTADAKFECDALARRETTKLTRPQLKENKPVAKDLLYTFQAGKTDYE